MSVQHAPAPVSPLLRGSVWQRLRIGSGLILFTFALTHFCNHALGLVSIEAMEAVQEWRTAVARSNAGTLVLAAALATHMGLNLSKTARRSTWRMPLWEAVQIVLGLSIPVLLFWHAGYMRGLHVLEGSDTPYSDMLPGLWNNWALWQTALLLVVWTHGCIGLHFWLRLSPNYPRMAPALFAAAVLIPALALAGFSVAGREAAALAAEEAAAAPVEVDEYGYPISSGAGAVEYDEYGQPIAAPVEYDEYGQPIAAAAEPALTAADVQLYAYWSAWALLALVAATLAIRTVLRRSGPRAHVSYTAGPSLSAPIGPTLLEMSRMFGVPHASVCGGRARCSTCRVRIEDAAPGLAPPAGAEAATLARVNAAQDTRLACQLRPTGDLTVTRLVLPPEARRPLLASALEDSGVERTLVILFLDIRGFTSLSEARLPYDTVFLLNRFFAEIGEAVQASGGWIDKYMGDGLMALFGLNQPTGAACRAALTAAMRIDAALEKLNRELAGELPAPLRIGIGLHVGPLVFGRIGHHASAATTVIGPAVNVASRLESLTKEHGVQIVASAELAEEAGLPAGAFPEAIVTVRGTSAPLKVLLIGRGGELGPFFNAGKRRSAA
ncbi:MAG TPA: adenylate/guanylate cyclase domain-containing protein [Afifellaceae bacterium]|nr:adenylate/guanylate cyclase domain-containing protein [Afifellaceae bacterium]